MFIRTSILLMGSAATVASLSLITSTANAASIVGSQSLLAYNVGASNLNSNWDWQISIYEPTAVGEKAFFRVANNSIVTAGADDGDSIITEIDFEDGLAGLITFPGLNLSGSGSGVSFVEGSPSGNDAGLSGWDSVFSANRKNQGGVSNGIDPGEYLDIEFELDSGSYLSLLANLILEPYRVRLHVQSVDSIGGGSLRAVTSTPPGNIPPPMVPSPAAAGLGLMGVCGLVLRRRR